MIIAHLTDQDIADLVLFYSSRDAANPCALFTASSDAKAKADDVQPICGKIASCLSATTPECPVFCMSA